MGNWKRGRGKGSEEKEERKKHWNWRKREMQPFLLTSVAKSATTSAAAEPKSAREAHRRAMSALIEQKWSERKHAKRALDEEKARVVAVSSKQNAATARESTTGFWIRFKLFHKFRKFVL